MKVSREEVVNELWHRGQLSWILYKHQLPIYKRIREILASDDVDMNSYVINCSRQFGKSFTEFLIAVEDCLRRPNETIVFVAPLKSQVVEIINGKTYGTIFATCPKDLIPNFKDSALNFPNGSRIRMAGTDNRNYENLRGGAANTVFLDEAGFMSNLEDGVLPTVEPMTKTTGGKVIFSSTPPESLDHDYHEVLRYHTEAGLISTFTIWDDKSLTEKQLQKIINQCKGRDTTKFKREFECKAVADTSKQVIPNFNEERQVKALLPDDNFKKDKLYNYWKKYVVADWGGRDKTAILFAHYNYKTKKVIIEDHLDLNGEQITGTVIANKIKEKVGNWDTAMCEVRYICDNNNPLIMQEMNITHRIPFVPTTKGRLHEMVETVKDWEFDDRIQYDPAAEFILKCVASAHWNNNRDEFARSKIYGHYDGMAALVYLIRNVDQYSDPLPVGVDTFTHLVIPQQNQQTVTTYRQLSNIFYNPKKNRSFE